MAQNRGLCAVFVAVALAGSLPRAALAQGDRERSAARSAADAGGDAFDQGRYAEALELFSRAEQLVHAPPHLLFMARSRDKLGKLVDAHETYLKIVKEPLAPSAPPAFKRAQTEAQAELGPLEARLAQVTVTVQGEASASAVLSMDGVDLPPAMLGIPFPIDPGVHVFSAHTQASKSSESRVSFREGARESVVLSLSEPQASAALPSPAIAGPSSPPPGTADATLSSTSGGKTWGIVLLSAGIAATGVATYLTVSSFNDRGKAKDIYDCDKTGGCSEDQKKQISSYDASADRSRDWAIAAYAVGAGGILTGALLLLTSQPAPAAQPKTSAFLLRDVHLDAGLGWLGASGRF